MQAAKSAATGAVIPHRPTARRRQPGGSRINLFGEQEKHAMRSCARPNAANNYGGPSLGFQHAAAEIVVA